MYTKEEKKIYMKKYRTEHQEDILKTTKKYCLINREKILKNKKKYRKAHKEEIDNYRKKYEYRKRKIDVNFRIKHNLRNRILKIFKNINRSKSTGKLVGCSIEFLKQYLEKQFKPGMSWSNYGKWHVDHKIPCCTFNLSKPSEQKKCFHYTNLQPLWAEENLKKARKLIKGR